MLKQLQTGSFLFASSAIAVIGYRAFLRHWRPVCRAGLSTKAFYWESKDGEHSYLEEVSGDRAMKWVEKRNEHCLKTLGDPTGTKLYEDVLAILDSKDKIPHARVIKGMVYNFWQDESNQRGLWRKTTLDSYRSESPNWEIVLDIDQLCKEENESWVYKGHTLNDITATSNRTLLHLSRGGSDAVVIREFDLLSKSFVPVEQGGFVLPEAKSRVSWLDNDTLLVGTDFGDGVSLTDSGYPRVIHVWRRGTDLKSSERVFSGDKTDVSVSGYASSHCGHLFEWRSRALTFYTSTYSVRRDGDPTWHDLVTLQEDAEVSQFLDQMLISLRSDWTVAGVTYPSGSLLSVGIMDYVVNGTGADMTLLFAPEARVSLDSFTALKDHLVIHLLDNVKSKLCFWKYTAAPASRGESKGGWALQSAEAEGVIRGASVRAYDSDECNLYWLTTSSFLQPSRLFLVDAAEGAEGVRSARVVKSLPEQFDRTGLVECQAEAVSEDGTIVPYFMIKRKDTPSNGSNKTLLYGYGGFEISLLPSYGAVTGATWLEDGGIYVLANIRGGGEFGPTWHQQALKANRKLAYDDFIAVAEHLIETGVTCREKLAIRGGSNGGLLMGNVMTRRPDLFGAVICQVPLLDMKRYSHLLAGASWMAEYGDPDVAEEWAYLMQYSAYHNIDPVSANTSYPPLLMMTSTKDDRVHPYHARCFVKRLEDIGCSNVLYYENIEGGHGGAADSKQSSFMTSLYTMFLENTIGK
jgi:prolyl oligopeptidase